MPSKPTKICAKAGCFNTTDFKFCDSCKNSGSVSIYQKPREKNAFYDTARWRKASEYFRQKNPWCVDCQKAGIDTLAEHVDHIIPITQGGEQLAESNLQSLCIPCHSRKTRVEMNAKVSDGMANSGKITIVCGPPGSGKSTYVKKRMKEEDIIVDMDLLYMALSNLPMYAKPDILLPYVLAARDAVIDKIAQKVAMPHAWIITSGAKASDRDRLKLQLKTNDVVVIEATINECLKNIGMDEKRSASVGLWEEIVRGWWSNYTK